MGVAKMLRAVLLVVAAASASAFAPAAVLPRAAQRTATNGLKMQLYNDGIDQGASVTAKYIGWGSLERPLTPAFDGTWAGDVGFDPLGISSLIDVRWLREAELKHGRVCMLAATGMLVQDVAKFPGVQSVFGDAKMTALHDAAVKQGAMQQLLVWIGFFELFGFVAIVQMLQGGDRQPGDFGFDPLNCAKDPKALARRQLVELKNGRLAMIATAGMLHHYFLTGKGPIELISSQALELRLSL